MEMYLSDTHFRKLERMYHAAPINEFFKPKLSVQKGKAEMRAEVRPEFFHAARAIHGAVYFKALDDAAFFAANSLVEDVFVLTINFNLYLLKPLDKGLIIARGSVLYESNNSLIGESVLYDQDENQIARGTGTFIRK